MKTFISVSLAIIAICLVSCSKKDSTDTSKTSSTSSNWSINGSSFKGTTTVFLTGNNSLLSTDQDIDNSQNVITINFASSSPASGSYDVVKSYSTLSGNQCTIEVAGTNNNAWYSPGGGTVNIKVSAGKITAAFSDISMINAGDNSSTTLSGTLVQE